MEFLSIWELAIVEIDQRSMFAFCHEYSNQKGRYLSVSPRFYPLIDRSRTSSGVADLGRLTGDLERDGLDLGIAARRCCVERAG